MLGSDVKAGGDGVPVFIGPCHEPCAICEKVVDLRKAVVLLKNSAVAHPDCYGRQSRRQSLA